MRGGKRKIGIPDETKCEHRVTQTTEDGYEFCLKCKKIILNN